MTKYHEKFELRKKHATLKDKQGISYFKFENVDICDEVPFGVVVLVVAIKAQTAHVVDHVRKHPGYIVFGPLTARRYKVINKSIPKRFGKNFGI